MLPGKDLEGVEGWLFDRPEVGVGLVVRVAVEVVVEAVSAVEITVFAFARHRVEALDRGGEARLVDADLLRRELGEGVGHGQPARRLAPGMRVSSMYLSRKA
jgi:hypothetical protein